MRLIRGGKSYELAPPMGSTYHLWRGSTHTAGTPLTLATVFRAWCIAMGRSHLALARPPERTGDPFPPATEP